MLMRTLGPQEGWIVRSHTSWGEEQSILHKKVETSPTCFQNLEKKSRRKIQIRQYRLVVDLSFWTIGPRCGCGLNILIR